MNGNVDYCNSMKVGDYLLTLDLFDYNSLTDLERNIIKYVNKNVESIIRVLLDYLEDNNGFTPEHFLPYNNLKIDNDTWNEMVYDLYDIVRSDVIREYVKPKYEFLLYVILQWWDDCIVDSEDLLTNKLDSNLVDKIKNTYTSEDGENYVLNAITNFKEYYYIIFTDQDFLPSNLERLIILFLKNPDLYKELFPDINLQEYLDLMPKDLREQFEELNYGRCESIKKDLFEHTLLQDLLFCSERLQANHTYKESLEDEMNDFIRDLLTCFGYNLRDQTRQGTSNGGKQAGEVDILVRKENIPYSIIEAMRLSSIDKAYISEHIDKIYKYDTLGNRCNFIISYVKISNFLKFWQNYLLFIESYNYPFEQDEFTIPLDHQYPELKWAVTNLKRNDIVTKLYHIVIHIPS